MMGKTNDSKLEAGPQELMHHPLVLVDLGKTLAHVKIWYGLVELHLLF